MLHKKGDRTDSLNYRGIALIKSIAKIFTQMLSARLMKWAKKTKILPESQASFQAKRGCDDNIFTVQSIIQLQRKRKLYDIFVDFKRAFDSMKHNIL